MRKRRVVLYIDNAAERPARKRDVEGKQRDVDAMNTDAIDHIGAGSRRDNDNFVACQLQVASKIVDLHFDPAQARNITIRDQSDLQSSGFGSRGLIGVSH